MALRRAYLLSLVITGSLSIQTPHAYGVDSRNATSATNETSGDLPPTVTTMLDRRVSSIVSSLTTNNDQIPGWLSSLESNGQWPDVNYATGCAVVTTDWPAQSHWQRLKLMSGVWHGGVPTVETYDHDASLLSAILTGMDWWFTRDFTNIACLDQGGSDKCPCSSTDTTLWSTNWYSNVIGIPSLVIETCLLLNDVLPQRSRDYCSVMTSRSHETLDRNPSPRYLGGANTMDISRIAIDQGVLTGDVDLLTSAYKRAHDELSVRSLVREDGVRHDGSFGQHRGLLYNGNYGKDYANDIIDVETIALGTEFAADNSSKSVIDLLFDGDRWMVFYNTLSGVLHWDFSALPRFISQPVADQGAAAGLNIDLDAVFHLGAAWNSTALQQFAALKGSIGRHDANAGSLNGNRMFYANDYMVHRGNGYVSTLKMYSLRTNNTECISSLNPFGFHLADGALYTYRHGNEYEDIAGAWDWDMIPGTTVDYQATSLTCNRASFMGIAPFVGGVSTGTNGIAAMRYVNPYTKALQWQKTWFFLEDDIQHVMVSGLTSTYGAPVYTVLDQKRHYGNVAVDADEDVSFSSSKTVSQPGASSLWHDGVGYTFDSQQPAILAVQVDHKTTNWSAIGPSTQPPADVDLFSAWLHHSPESLDVPISYTIFPSVDRAAFVSKSTSFKLQSIVNDAHVSAVYDQVHYTAMFVFWDVDGGQATLDISSAQNPNSTLLVQSNGNVALIYDGHRIFISDPSQMRDTVEIKLMVTDANGVVSSKELVVALPRDGSAGSTQIVDI